MRRGTFDIVMAVAGLFLAVTLIAAGGLLTWAHSFTAAAMLVLGALGLVHARRTSATSDILDGHPRHTSGPGTVPLQTTGASGNGLGTTMPGSSAEQTA